jgi:hypothetical protein
MDDQIVATQDLVVIRDETLYGGAAATATYSPDRLYRYVLTRRWKPGPLVAWVMLNPSTAGAHKPDNTITRCVDYARRWQYAGIVVVNLFALRSTKPEALLNHFNPVGPANDAVIREQLTHPDVGRVMVAWGANAGQTRLTGRDAQVITLMSELGVQPMCLSRTKNGHPWHPLRMPANIQPIPFPTDRQESGTNR